GPEERARAKVDLGRRSGASNAFGVKCDLLDASQIELAVQEIIDRFGKIDILINNAGIIEVGPLENMTREDFERAMRLHFWAAYELIFRIIPEMGISAGARTVNTSSIGVKVASPNLSPFRASEFGQAGLSYALAANRARHHTM